MALVNHTKREINAKIVIFGPEQAGKSTNLNYIFRKLKPERRGKLKMMNLQKDRMLFFDFLPGQKGDLNGYTLRFHLYTVVGEGIQPSSWKMVLKGADGIVFVADSDAGKMVSNQECLRQLTDLFAAYGSCVDDTSLVVQYNKRDVPTALSVEDMQRMLDTGSSRIVKAVANRGEGVLESLFTAIKGVQRRLRDEGLQVKESEQAEEESPEEPTGCSRLTGVATEASKGQGRGEDAPLGAGAVTSSADGTMPADVQLAGAPEACPGGLKIPLSIRCGGCSRSATVTITVSLESGEGQG